VLEEKQMLKLYRTGHTELLEQLIDLHKNSLYKFCYHLTSDKFDAEDLFQDTWARAIQCFDSFNEQKTFGNWLFSIALNAYRDRYRKRKRWLNRVLDFFSNDEKDTELMRVPDTEPSPEQQVVGEELRSNIKACVNMLEDSFRIPLILFYFKQLRYEDISEILGIPVGTVKSRLNAGKAKLRKMLEVKGYAG
jgi:RNA polymerase sigma-70 factor (ECF subfamily)